jgi:hypothetical protein
MPILNEIESALAITTTVVAPGGPPEQLVAGVRDISQAVEVEAARRAVQGTRLGRDERN